jgi:hypothetical protein
MLLINEYLLYKWTNLKEKAHRFPQSLYIAFQNDFLKKIDFRIDKL